MSLPAYTVWFRGLPACPCLAEWLPVFERLLIHRGVIRESIDIAQLIGGAAASGGTHALGGAWDIWQHDPETQRLAREMGAAAWNRTAAQGFDPHTHGVLNGCPHNSPARYQIAALAAGGSGLGSGGMGSSDYGPGPRTLRTWREGIAWAEQQMGDLDMDEKTLRAIVSDVIAPTDRKLDALLKQEKGERARDKADRERWRKLRAEVREGKRDIRAALEEALAALDPE